MSAVKTWPCLWYGVNASSSAPPTSIVLTRPLLVRVRLEGSAPDGAVDFVMSGGVEALLAPLQLPATCGAATCGADVAVVRGEGGGFEARLLEVNARTTMPHYARAAFAALGEQGGARAYQRFAIVDAASVAGALEDEAPAALCLTDPHGARFCACLMRAE